MSKEQEYLCKTKSQHFFDAIGWSFTWGLKIVGIIFISIVTWRIANVNVDISYFKDYNFNDLLSLILALFAILISILFYFILNRQNQVINSIQTLIDLQKIFQKVSVVLMSVLAKK